MDAARTCFASARSSGAEHIKLFCDVDKKHSLPSPGLDLETHIEWTEFTVHTP